MSRCIPKSIHSSSLSPSRAHGCTHALCPCLSLSICTYIYFFSDGLLQETQSTSFMSNRVLRRINHVRVHCAHSRHSHVAAFYASGRRWLILKRPGTEYVAVKNAFKWPYFFLANARTAFRILTVGVGPLVLSNNTYRLRSLMEGL